MKHFEADVILSSREVDSSTQDGDLDLLKYFCNLRKDKLANVILEILDVFLRNEFRCTEIQSPRFCKCLEF